MVNEAGSQFPRNNRRRGEILRASELNRIVDALIRRLEGGRNINIRKLNGQIIIEATDQ